MLSWRPFMTAIMQLDCKYQLQGWSSRPLWHKIGLLEFKAEWRTRFRLGLRYLEQISVIPLLMNYQMALLPLIVLRIFLNINNNVFGNPIQVNEHNKNLYKVLPLYWAILSISFNFKLKNIKSLVIEVMSTKKITSKVSILQYCP